MKTIIFFSKPKLKSCLVGTWVIFDSGGSSDGSDGGDGHDQKLDGTSGQQPVVVAAWPMVAQTVVSNDRTAGMVVAIVTTRLARGGLGFQKVKTRYV